MNQWLQDTLFHLAGTVDQWRFAGVGIALVVLAVLLLAVALVVSSLRTPPR